MRVEYVGKCECTDELVGGSRGKVQYDSLGFVVRPEGDELEASIQAYQKRFEKKAMSQRAAFEAHSYNSSLTNPWTCSSELKRLCRGGIPHEHRAAVWWCTLGCKERQQQLPNAYTKYLEESIDPSIEDRIQRDLHRTLPNHRKFQDTVGRAMLHDVLHAFACHFPRIGYCQGLNAVAALLLVVFVEAEPAFWAFICAMENLNLEEYYTEGLVLLRVDMVVLSIMLPRKVRHRLKKHDADMLLICSEWFLTWFARSCPVHTVLRIWDVLFSEGHTVLFRVAIGVFQNVRADLMECSSFDEMMKNSRTWSRRQIEHDELLRQSFSSLTTIPFSPYERLIYHRRNKEFAFLGFEEWMTSFSSRTATVAQSRWCCFRSSRNLE